MDVPWSPFDVDGRNFEWPALALAADLLFVMAYDMQVRAGHMMYQLEHGVESEVAGPWHWPLPMAADRG